MSRNAYYKGICRYMTARTGFFLSHLSLIFSGSKRMMTSRTHPLRRLNYCKAERSLNDPAEHRDLSAVTDDSPTTEVPRKLS